MQDYGEFDDVVSPMLRDDRLGMPVRRVNVDLLTERVQIPTHQLCCVGKKTRNEA